MDETAKTEALPPLPAYFDDCTDRTRNEVQAYARAAIAQDRASRGGGAGVAQWISVDDRLPEVNVKVLFYRAEGFCFGWRVTDTEWTDDSFQDRDGFCTACYGVTHWMPQPAAPSEVAAVPSVATGGQSNMNDAELTAVLLKVYALVATPHLAMARAAIAADRARQIVRAEPWLKSADLQERVEGDR